MGNIGIGDRFFSDEEGRFLDAEEGFQVGNNPGGGAYRSAGSYPVGSAPRRTTAQLNWTGDTPYYKRVLEDIQKKNNLSKLNSLAYLSFDYHRLKSRSDIDVLIEVYKLLDKSLNKKVKT